MKSVITAEGPSTRYAGTAGESYFAWQKASGNKGAIYNRSFFQPYVRESDTVLDFGCGGGYALQGLCCRTKVGVDVNPAAQAEGRRLGIEILPDLDALVDRTFDVVISSHCLEHVPNPYEALVNLRKVLRKGGKLVLLLPLDDWRNEPWCGPDTNGHLYAWTPRLLGNLLVTACFEPTFIKVVSTWPPKLDRQIWAINRTLFAVLGYLSSVALRRRQIWALAAAK